MLGRVSPPVKPGPAIQAPETSIAQQQGQPSGISAQPAAIHGWRPLYTVRCLMGGTRAAV